MKKTILTLILFVGIFSISSAQVSKSIGARLGWPIELSFQTPVGDANRLELGAGLGTGFVGVSAFYQFVNDLSNVSEGMNWYFGFGALADMYTAAGYSGFIAGVGVQGGVEYDLERHINVPLMLSLDWRPAVVYNSYLSGLSGLVKVSPIQFWGDGFALGVRYKF